MKIIMEIKPRNDAGKEGENCLHGRTVDSADDEEREGRVLTDDITTLSEEISDPQPCIQPTISSTIGVISKYEGELGGIDPIDDTILSEEISDSHPCNQPANSNALGVISITDNEQKSTSSIDISAKPFSHFNTSLDSILSSTSDNYKHEAPLNINQHVLYDDGEVTDVSDVKIIDSDCKFLEPCDGKIGSISDDGSSCLETVGSNEIAEHDTFPTDKVLDSANDLLSTNELCSVVDIGLTGDDVGSLTVDVDSTEFCAVALCESVVESASSDLLNGRTLSNSTLNFSHDFSTTDLESHVPLIETSQPVDSDAAMIEVSQSVDSSQSSLGDFSANIQANPHSSNDGDCEIYGDRVRFIKNVSMNLDDNDHKIYDYKCQIKPKKTLNIHKKPKWNTVRPGTFELKPFPRLTRKHFDAFIDNLKKPYDSWSLGSIGESTCSTNSASTLAFTNKYDTGSHCIETTLIKKKRSKSLTAELSSSAPALDHLLFCPRKILQNARVNSASSDQISALSVENIDTLASELAASAVGDTGAISELPPTSIAEIAKFPSTLSASSFATDNSSSSSRIVDTRYAISAETVQANGDNEVSSVSVGNQTGNGVIFDRLKACKCLTSLFENGGSGHFVKSHKQFCKYSYHSVKRLKRPSYKHHQKIHRYEHPSEIMAHIRFDEVNPKVCKCFHNHPTNIQSSKCVENCLYKEKSVQKFKLDVSTDDTPVLRKRLLKQKTRSVFRETRVPTAVAVVSPFRVRGVLRKFVLCFFFL